MREMEKGKKVKWEKGESASLFSISPLPLFLLTALLLAFAVSCRRGTENTPRRAAEAWDSGDYKLAAEEYEQYIERNPTGGQSLDARFKLANIYYFNLRRYEQARAHYAEFLHQDASNPGAQAARERLAEVLGELGRSYEAIAEYENLSPRDTTERRRIRLRIADLYFDQKNYSQALTEYDKVIESADYDDLSEQAYLREASIYNSRSQYQLSLVAYRKLAGESDDAEVQMRATYGLVDCYAGLYQFDEAIKTLRSIKDEREREHIAQRVSELETQKREAAQAKSGLQR
jgi:tetratricopeptide (TPR) repeat protein